MLPYFCSYVGRSPGGFLSNQEKYFQLRSLAGRKRRFIFAWKHSISKWLFTRHDHLKVHQGGSPHFFSYLYVWNCIIVHVAFQLRLVIIVLGEGVCYSRWLPGEGLCNHIRPNVTGKQTKARGNPSPGSKQERKKLIGSQFNVSGIESHPGGRVWGPQKANICKAAACPHFLNGVSDTLNGGSINTCCHSSTRNKRGQTPIVTPPSCSLSLSLSHTHTQAKTYIHTRTHNTQQMLPHLQVNAIYSSKLVEGWTCRCPTSRTNRLLFIWLFFMSDEGRVSSRHTTVRWFEYHWFWWI